MKRDFNTIACLKTHAPIRL